MRQNSIEKGSAVHLVLIGENRRIFEGVLLAAGRNTIRAAVRGIADTIELARIEGRWLDDKGQEFEVASLVVGSPAEAQFLASLMGAQALAAGRAAPWPV